MPTTTRLLLILILFFPLLTACSLKPNETEIQTQVTARLLKDGADQIIEIKNFRKTDGYKESDNRYIAYVSYDVVFKKGLKDVVRHIESNAKDNPLKGLGAGLEMMALQIQYGNFKAGHAVTKEEKIEFIKTEKGWRIKD